jgi:hypothetical protein
MNPWQTWKKLFNAWESSTSRMFERVLETPAVLEPAGAWLSAFMKMKAAGDKAAAQWWGTLGLPTKRDQERTLHAIHQLHSRVLDLEERLAERS